MGRGRAKSRDTESVWGGRSERYLTTVVRDWGAFTGKRGGSHTRYDTETGVEWIRWEPPEIMGTGGDFGKKRVAGTEVREGQKGSHPSEGRISVVSGRSRSGPGRDESGGRGVGRTTGD